MIYIYWGASGLKVMPPRHPDFFLIYCMYLKHKNQKHNHTMTRYKHEILYCHVITNSHYCSCHSVPSTYLRLTHENTILITQANEQNTFNSAQTQTLASEFKQIHPKLRFLQRLLTMLAFYGRLSAAMFMFIKGLDEGLEAFETSWGLCFCCFEGKKKTTKVACAVPISLCSTRNQLPIWGAAARCVNGGPRKGYVVRRSRCL